MKRVAGLVGASLAFLAIAGAGASPLPVRMAFVKGGSTAPPTVWVASGDGTHQRKLAAGDTPRISPDASMVAVANTLRNTGPALTIYASTGAVLHRFFNFAVQNGTPTAWSPDSRYLAVTLYATDPNRKRNYGLAVIDTTTMRARVISHGTIQGASFAPDGSDRIVFAQTGSIDLASPVDVHRCAADGTGCVKLTHDGRSLNPVWGSRGIAYDRERMRHNDNPVYQVWLMNGSTRTQLTNMHIPTLLSGLVPVQFSADGNHLLADYAGQDTSEAWALVVSTRRVHQLGIDGVEPAGISADGGTVLVDSGAFLLTPNQGVIETVAFTGGHKRRLARGAEPTWSS
jgi:hypothetical protein